MDKDNMVCMYSGILHSHKKAKFCPSAMWMDLQNIMLNEDRQKHFLWYYLYVESKITIVYVKQKQTHRCINKLVVTNEDR